MDELQASTHPVQLYALACMAVANIIALYLVNKHKQSNSPPNLSWESRRNAFWTIITLCVGLSCFLDIHYYIDTKYAMPIKSYIFAFPLGILDLYFSETKGVPMKVILGAALWCSTVILRQIVIDYWFGRSVDTMVILTEFNLFTMPKEVLRYVTSLVGIGLCSDLLFSPMHRITHSSIIYKRHHKEHHEYTNKLTALVLYYGTLLDDFLMPFTTTIGGFIYMLFLNQLGCIDNTFSNLTGYLFVFNTLLSHAHDVRCSRLLAPLPDELNFVAYHYVHHLSPCNNYGLTEPSDQFWDFVLGVKTIVKLEDLIGKDKFI